MNTSFERKTGSMEWLTPPEILEPLGKFDLDPCASLNRPWDTAKKHYTILDNGLLQEWEGRVWLNPPYGKETGQWLRKLALHGNGIALTFARTETAMFFSHVWNKADAILFIAGRVRFCNSAGKQLGPAGAPSCLIAYGQKNVETLEWCDFLGKLVYLKKGGKE